MPDSPKDSSSLFADETEYATFINKTDPEKLFFDQTNSTTDLSLPDLGKKLSLTNHPIAKITALVLAVLGHLGLFYYETQLDPNNPPKFIKNIRARLNNLTKNELFINKSPKDQNKLPDSIENYQNTPTGKENSVIISYSPLEITVSSKNPLKNCFLSPSPETIPKKWEFQEIHPGLDFCEYEGPEVNLGTRKIRVVKIDSSKYEFKPYRYDEKDSPVASPQPIDYWGKKFSAPVLFNAGQYDPEYGYMGILKRDGEKIGKQSKITSWKGILVSGKNQKAQILNINDPQIEKYPNAIQSFMLFSGEKNSVRKSNWQANRLIVAQSKDGHLYIFHTDGGITLWNLAEHLKKLPLNLEKALSMDGGYEAELFVQNQNSFFGQWETNDLDISLPGIHYDLPSVVAVISK